jgi:hypothetical protein
VASGYARASAIVDQPPPHPTSTIRVSGRRSAASRSVTPLSARGRACSNHGRFMSAWDSRMSVPNAAQLTPPPVRYASISAGSCIPAAHSIRASGAR